MKRITMIKHLVSMFLIVTILLTINAFYYTPQAYAINSNSERNTDCQAQITDNFADDSLLVVFNNQTSIACKTYTVDDFPEIKSKSITHITSYVESKIKKAIDAAVDSAKNRQVAVIDHELHLDKFNQILCIELENPSKQNILDAIKAIEKRDDVLYARPDYYWDFYSDSNNTTYNTEFNTQTAATKIQLNDAWNLIADMELNDVSVAVFDSGIDGNHSDLAPNLSDTGHYSYFESLDALLDSYGHGTKVAGVIAGVAKNVTLLSYRVDDTTDVKSSYVYYAIYQAIEDNVQIINLSLGWRCGELNNNLDNSDNYDPIVAEAIEDYDGLIVCAAGNNSALIDDNDETYNYYPSQYDFDNLIVVGASTNSDAKKSDSNYGSTSVDLFAPGESITTTISGGGRGTGGQTSMAAPFVTGVAALLLSIDNTLTPQQIKDYIIDSVDDCDGNFENLCVSDGRLNAYGALLELQNNCNHNYDYSHSANSHISTCTICAHRETFNYALYISSRTSSSITVKCMDCNEQIVCSHSRQYQSLGDSSHKITCNSCGIWVTDLHSKQYADPESNTEHIASCSLCDYSTVEEHNLYVIEVDEDDTLHIGCDLCSLYIMCDHNIYECQDTLTHVVDCMDCDICFTEEHKYSITNVNNSNHKVRCDVCGYAYYQSHNYYEASWEEFMEVGCTKCSLSIDCIHVEVYDYNDTGHSISCSSCGYEITGTHNFYRCVNTGSASYHTLYCWDCEYTKSVSHIFLYSSTDNELNHSVYCSDCGYLGTQSHTWVLTLGEYECMYCGQRSSSTPSNPIASIPPKNDEDLTE